MTNAYLPKFAALCMKGSDSINFLQKMSTQNINLIDDHPLSTVLVDQQGKIIDVIYVFKQNDHLLIFCHNPQAQIIIDWLEKYHFAENFIIEKSDKQAIITLEKDPLKNSYILFKEKDLYACLHVNANEHQNFMTDEQWHSMRIAHLYPWFPYEINSQYMPQNIGLKKLIDLNKGCFIGQEVLAKALIYQKNPLFLIGLTLNEQDLQKQEKIMTNEQIGIITSKSFISKPKIINCLAVVKKNN